VLIIAVVIVLFAGVVKIINTPNVNRLKVVIVPGSIVIVIAIAIAVVIVVVAAIGTTAIDGGFNDPRNSFVFVFVPVPNSRR